MRHAKVDEGFFMCNHAETVRLADWLYQIRGLSLAEQFGFMVVPVNTRDEPVMDALVDFATQYAQSGPVTLRMDVDVTVPKVSRTQSLASRSMNGMCPPGSLYRCLQACRWHSASVETLLPRTTRAAIESLCQRGLGSTPAPMRTPR